MRGSLKFGLKQEIARLQKTPEPVSQEPSSMYLAKQKIKGKIRYFIRESYLGKDGARSRDLFDLGPDPSTYIVYPDENSFYIHGAVEESLESLGVQPGWEELEDIFWPFLDPEIKRVIEPFRQRSGRLKKKDPRNPAREAKIHATVHIFDKRRIHYLRFGQMDQGNIGRMPAVLLKGLVGKSRDEIEQHFMVLEQSLRPAELKKYVFVIFDLQRFFKELMAKKFPEGLDQNKVDRHFLEEVCRLNQNPVFWGGPQQQEELHEYLVRYVIMFFDTDYGHSTVLSDYIKDFIRRHRFYRPPPPQNAVSVDEAGKIFEVKKDDIKTLSIRGLTKLYRRQAQKVHPDKGGDHEKFIKLTEAYQTLLKKIREVNYDQGSSRNNL